MGCRLVRIIYRIMKPYTQCRYTDMHFQPKHIGPFKEKAVEKFM